jgi:hypothetical protein
MVKKQNYSVKMADNPSEKHQVETRAIKREDFDKMLKGLASVPPLKLKDLKKQLKREREEKKKELV